MNPELKKKWVAALRSGEYKQGSNRLRNLDNTFCCLGVLADVIAPQEWREASHCFSFRWDWNKLPGDELAIDTQRKLMEMNDGVGSWWSKPQTFDQIATWIEENL